MFTIDQQEIEAGAADNFDDHWIGQGDPGADDGFAAIEFVFELGHCEKHSRYNWGKEILNADKTANNIVVFKLIQV